MIKLSKVSLGEWIKAKIDNVSAPLTYGTVELLGNFEASIHGCKKIIHYTPEKIKLAMKKKGGFLTIEGSELVCTSFFIGAVVIEGKIERVELSENGAEGEK